ncbi:MAG: FlgD immunoglobulin-like domain containing protein [Fibrobacteria bacterium]
MGLRTLVRIGSRIILGTAITALTAFPAFAQKPDSSLSFFITSKAIGKGGNLGGLAGADAHCADLAAKAGATRKIWKAYLSTQATADAPAVNARDRIGSGPWFNSKKVMIASSVDNLHSSKNNVGIGLSLTEIGTAIPYSGGASRHDILTGSDSDGTAFSPGPDSTCGNWTKETTEGGAYVGHYNKDGGGDHPKSWNSAHLSYGCSNAKFVESNCGGYIYCFAADAPTGLRGREGQGEMRRLGEYLQGESGSAGERVFGFELSEASQVEVQVVDMQGRIVATLARGRMRAGAHEARWNGHTDRGEAVPAGAYWVRLNFR